MQNPVDSSTAVENAIAYLRTPQAIRDRCGNLFELANQDKLQHFRLDLKQLQPTAEYVLQTIRENYPDLKVPFHSRWRHFTAGGVDRTAAFEQKIAHLDAIAQAKAKFDLVILSVLLDAGAGAAWKYQETETGQISQRSEGLAIASYHTFCQGTFSANPSDLLRADASRLQTLTESDLANGFQVTSDNPLVGLSGRTALLQSLGNVLTKHPALFGDQPRPGNLVDYLLAQATDNQLAAAQVLQAVLVGLGDIWAGRVSLGEVSLGDVWPHPALSNRAPGANLVPFHKLSQWLTYSLLEPLQDLGLEITGLDEMTGLAEYRNGGLCVDLGLLQPKHEDVLTQKHSPGSAVIVEWRSLTIICLDQIAAAIRRSLNLDAIALPLVKVLEGGTWAAGRKIAAAKRPGGDPPIQIESDGTVF